mmetsp:Transcript_81816/g.252658  ORF Transcript_81816/g.252658 Transcript_81816/m.252658 type:complete len:216 (-) Transcript_81816:303-950(-)
MKRLLGGRRVGQETLDQHVVTRHAAIVAQEAEAFRRPGGAQGVPVHPGQAANEDEPEHGLQKANAGADRDLGRGVVAEDDPAHGHGAQEKEPRGHSPYKLHVREGPGVRDPQDSGRLPYTLQGLALSGGLKLQTEGLHVSRANAEGQIQEQQGSKTNGDHGVRGRHPTIQKTGPNWPRLVDQVLPDELVDCHDDGGKAGKVQRAGAPRQQQLRHH